MSLRRKFVNSANENKKCSNCKNTYPRNENYFYATVHRTLKNAHSYDGYCIKCRNELSDKWRAKNKEYKQEVDLKYRQSERGYLMGKWNTIKKSRKSCLIKSFEEFLECWENQKKEYGEYCPYYPHIKLTRILGKGSKGKIDSNLSVDRLVNCLPYSKDNIMFVSWKANNEKGEISHYLAERIVDLIDSKENLRMFIEMDTYKRNGQKFSFEQYHQRLAEERKKEVEREILNEKFEKVMKRSEEVSKKTELILKKSREQSKEMIEELKKYEME